MLDRKMPFLDLSLTLSPSAEGYQRLLQQIEQNAKALLPNSSNSTHILTSNSASNSDIEEWRTLFQVQYILTGIK